jgi:hypothetical protein
MELTPVMSRARPAAMLCGGAAVVCLAGAWLTPVSASTAYPTSSSQDAAAVHLVAEVTPLPSAPPSGGPGAGPGGGSDGSSGSAVAPGPTKHQSNGESSSSASGESVSGHASSSQSEGPIASVFKKVGRWLGVSSDDSSSSSDSAAAAPTKAKPANTASTDSADADKSSKASIASGVGDVLHSVFSGVGRLFSSLFGR